MTKHWTLTLVFAAILLLACAPGCDKQPDKQDAGATSTPAPTIYEVALLGDKTRTDLLSSIASKFGSTVDTSGNQMVAEMRYGDRVFRLLVIADDNTAAQAGLAWDADLVLLAVDTTNQGTLLSVYREVHREHVIVARQMAVPDVVIVFTKSHLIDDSELLELEEMEMRELLNTYKLPGDDALCVFDHPEAKTGPDWKPPKGPAQIVQALDAFAKKRSPAKSVREGKRFRASVYSLNPQEAFARDIAIPVKTGPTTVLVGNEKIDAEVTVLHEIAPGENGVIEVNFARPIRVGEGQRFLLLHKEHVAAAGDFLEERTNNR